MKYQEIEKDSESFREKYFNGIRELILDRQLMFEQQRKEYCKDIFTDTERYRDDFRKILGWPLTEKREETLPDVRITELSKEENYTIYRMHFEILPNLEMTGLYFEMNGEKKPLVIVQHGGLGTPEVVSGFYNGETQNYHNMLERVIANDVHAFAPQLLLWDKERYGVNYDRAQIDARLKRVGSSITAVELYGIQRILDYFEKKDNVSSFGMVGLSYGGFYTLLMAALDTRIKSSISCAFFHNADNHPTCDRTWFCEAEKFDRAEVAAMVYPRKLCVEIGKEDKLFNMKFGEKSYLRLVEMCKDVGTDWLNFITFDGTHEFCKDDEPIKEMIEHIKGC